jgi:signal transduction histidine kinase
MLLSSAIILVSFVIMGTVSSYSLSQYWINDKLESMTGSAESLSSIASHRSMQTGEDSYTISNNAQYVFATMVPTLQADAYVVNACGEVVISAFSQNQVESVQMLDASVVQEAMKGSYSDVTRLSVYPEDQYVVGVPLVYQNNGQSKVIGAVFLVSSARSFRAFRGDIIQMCIITAIFAAAISFLLSGALTYRMVMPLREMATAAVAFGKGDFTRRVPVRGRDEISELAVAFNNMATSLAESENINRSFVANVSHELKTPMTTIAGFINGILDGTISRAQQNHYLRIVSSEVMRLSRLVQSMLNLSRIDSGKMVLRQSEFDLQQVVFDTMLSFEGLITGRKIEVEGMEECQSVRVVGDADLLHQVVYNLVENAVKFTNEGGTITVSLRERNGNAQVIIRNTGAGIPQEELPLVFERFYKTDKSRSNDKNGMGLGLYIVRTIIQLHGGEIEVRSRENEYCEFEFRIPVQNDNAVWKK